MGNFGESPHRKHFCENCGVDTNWSKEPIISNPLTILKKEYPSNNFVDNNLNLDLRDYPGCTWQIWSSTPAILWTSDKPQVEGIHVHIYKEGKLIVDDTFNKVINVDGSLLNKTELLKKMLASYEN